MKTQVGIDNLQGLPGYASSILTGTRGKASLRINYNEPDMLIVFSKP